MKRFTLIIIAAICMLLQNPTAVYAVNSQPSNLTVIMEYGDITLSGINVAVCRVADAREVKGAIVYEAVQAFSGMGIDFSDMTKEKNIALAASLDAYASANNIEQSVNITDNNGKATFSGLAAGLYLVAQKDAETSEYVVAPYLVALPNLSETGDGWNYNVTAYPKTEPIKRNVDTTSVSVFKIWVGPDSPPSDILVQLYKNSQPYGDAISLSNKNYWSYTWDGLSAGDTWTVDEFDVPAGYIKTISGSSSAGYIIINTSTKVLGYDGTITIEGNKSWYHRTREDEVYIPEAEKPKSITLYVKADGELVLQKLITAADNWSWSIVMDKYTEDGHEIVYTINEEKIEDYRKWIVGSNEFSIINEYSPGDNTDEIPDVSPPTGYPDDGPNGPRTKDSDGSGGGQGSGTPGTTKTFISSNVLKTGDTGNIRFWIILNVVGLVTILCILNSKRLSRIFMRRDK